MGDTIEIANEILRLSEDGSVSHLVDGVRESELRFPWSIGDWRQFGDRLFLLLAPDSEGTDEPNAVIEDPSRNLVRVDPDGGIRWIAEGIDGSNERAFHEDVLLHDERLITRTNTGVFCEFVVETGELVRSWSSDEFHVGSQRHAFDEPVESFDHTGVATVVQTADELVWIDRSGEELSRHTFEMSLSRHSYEILDGYIIVAAKTDNGNRETLLMGFDETGGELWRRRLEYGWALSVNADHVHVYTQIGKRRHTTLALDPETGTLSAVSGPVKQVERYLDE